MTEIHDVIADGDPIPGDVTGVEDREGDAWQLEQRRGWYCLKFWFRGVPLGSAAVCEGLWLSQRWGPLTVTAVRKEPAEPERKCPGCGERPHPPLSCVEARDARAEQFAEPEPQQSDASPLLDLAHDFEPYQWDSLRCGYIDGDDAMCGHYPDEHQKRPNRIAKPEPRQADAPVLDLVRQLHDAVAIGWWEVDEAGRDQAHALLGRIAALIPQQAYPSDLPDLVRQYGDALLTGMHGAPDYTAARQVLDRIAALVPQQPVQARDGDGMPLWMHLCGYVEAFRNVPLDVAPFGGGCDACDSGYPQPGDWRPLLVGGDPAPETSADAFRQARDEALRQRDVARDVVDDRRRLRTELDEARAEVERLKADVKVFTDVFGAKPDRQVLSLPEVPEGTEALTGLRTGVRYPRMLNGWGPGGWPRSLSTILTHEHPHGVRVELAPPCESRTAAEVWIALGEDDRDQIKYASGVDNASAGLDLARALDREAGL